MNSHRQSVATALEEVPIDGREAAIEFTRVTVLAYDPHYGADADGNRGIGVWEVDEDYAEGVTVWFTDEPRTSYDSGLCCTARHANAVPPWTCDCVCHSGGGESVVKPLDSLPEGQRAQITAALDTYIETHEPEVVEEDEPDPDDERDRRMDRDEDDWRRER